MESRKIITIVSSTIAVLLVAHGGYNLYRATDYENSAQNQTRSKSADEKQTSQEIQTDDSNLEQSEASNVIYDFFTRYYSWDSGLDFDAGQQELRNQFPNIVTNAFVSLDQNYQDDLDGDINSSATADVTVYQNANKDQCTVLIEQQKIINGNKTDNTFIIHAVYSDGQLTIDAFNQDVEV